MPPASHDAAVHQMKLRALPCDSHGLRAMEVAVF
eukprot:CAMPEP_0115132368 /NCGR_PEP_ID=MMETSP0227-20121206/53694_1 /TAXON_ID=89957 /ORGANISM="Polarella glacialis, Strain CCMP 1383" /LENGTH=33 /DNA_ID= /DNA_START= /DNA_END= /DNA_ORIENTATION=